MNRSQMVERLAAWLGVATLVVMKFMAASRYRFNTDETQHLHVIWGWAHGLIQYRDVFDNHPPLFHMLMAPLFRLFPERADIVVPMRLLMIPFYVASLAALARLGRALYSARAGLWLALLAGALPAPFFAGTEFRPDDLYAAIWFWSLVILIEGRCTPARMAGAGLLLGACTGITMKTSLLVTSLTLSAAIAFALRLRQAQWRPSVSRLFLNLLALGAASLVIPALLCLYFAAHGSLHELYYYVLKHNIVPRAERWGGSKLHFVALPAALPFLTAAAFWIYRQDDRPERATRRVIISLLPLFYLVLLYGYWPDITDQDDLPCYPLLPFAAMPLIAAFEKWRGTRKPSFPSIPGFVLPAATVLICFVLIWRTEVLQRGSVTKYVTPIATVLRLTTPDDYVMDLKGDAVYRKRPFYYGLETFAKIRLKAGWIKNTIVPDLIATKTPVCFHPPFTGADANQFVQQNYLPLAGQPRVWVLGQKLTPDAAGTVHFKVTIPAEYVLLLQDSTPAGGTLDGTPCTGPRTVTAGDHQFVPPKPSSPILLFWSRAWALGYQPSLKGGAD